MRSHDTLYSLSLEGQATAGPLVTAVTAVIIGGAEDYANTQRRRFAPVAAPQNNPWLDASSGEPSWVTTATTSPAPGGRVPARRALAQW